MTVVKSAAKERQAAEFKEFYHAVVKNVFAEALEHEVGQDAIYAWRNPNKTNNMPAYAIINSLYGDEILSYLAAKRGKGIMYKLDGSVDDDWAELSVLFSLVRKKFLAGDSYDFTIANELKHTLDRLLAEWHEKE